MSKLLGSITKAQNSHYMYYAFKVLRAKVTNLVHIDVDPSTKIKL